MYSNNLLKNNLIVFPSNEGKSEICDFLYQTCRILAKKNLVIVINIQKAKSLKEILTRYLSSRSDFKVIVKHDGVYYFTPILLIPFRRFPTVVKVNIILNIITLQLVLLMMFRTYENKLLWFFFPQLAYLHKYFGKRWKTIYDVIDFYTSPDQKLNNQLNIQKKYLLDVSYMVTAISETLKSAYLQLSPREIFVVPQGFNSGMFKSSKRTPQFLIIPQDRPTIGFIGHINERLDFKLLSKLIKRHSEWKFVFIGPKETNINVAVKAGLKQLNELLSKENVLWIDQQPKENIPFLIDQFSICMIPYDTQYAFNRYCYPMKVFEYFFAGKPVISTDIIELRKLQPLLVTTNSLSSWETAIQTFLEKPWPKTNILKQKKMALENSWEKKLEKISEYFE